MAVYTLTRALQFCADRSVLDTSARSTREYTRFANDALGLLRMSKLFEADRKKSALLFYAPFAGPGSTQGGAGTATGLVFTTATSCYFDFTGGLSAPGFFPQTFLYFNGENIGYEVVTAGIVGLRCTLSLGTPYLGSTLTGAAPLPFVLGFEMGQLPSDFRSLGRPDNGSLQYLMNPVKDLTEMDQWRRRITYYGIPQYYGVQWRTQVPTSQLGVKYPWMRIYPAPAVNTIIDFWYHSIPVELVAGSDMFGLPDDPSSATIIEAYLDASMKLRAGDQAGYMQGKAFADDLAKQLAAILRPIVDDYPGRRPYREAGERGNGIYPVYAPGIVTGNP